MIDSMPSNLSGLEWTVPDAGSAEERRQRRPERPGQSLALDRPIPPAIGCRFDSFVATRQGRPRQRQLRPERCGRGGRRAARADRRAGGSAGWQKSSKNKQQPFIARYRAARRARRHRPLCQRCVAHLRKGMSDGIPGIAGESAYASCAIENDPKALAFLKGLSEHEKPNVRLYALSVVQRLRAVQALPLEGAIIKRLEEQDPQRAESPRRSCTLSASDLRMARQS